MAGSSLPPLFLPILLVLLYAALPAHAFGAGNIASISKIEGANWRHGDIEDTLLQLLMARSLGGKKFDSMTIKRVYFGNWLRDYSQAIDVGALKYVEGPTIRLILWMLSFMTFGYGTGAFEVTEERLGCYRPEEHIDNPKDYADNLDARKYDRRLRCPVVEEVELDIDLQTGMKNYIANENIHQLPNGERMHTSAALVRDLFRRCIDLGREFGRSGDKAQRNEALRLLGTGLHCLEDFSAHSNYVELALIYMGETMIFPHVGSYTEVDIQGRRLFPLVTGTFGGVDFLHSVLGEFSDKAVQSEIEQLEGTINQAATQSSQDGGEHSIIRDLLKKLPIGGADDLDNQATELENKSKAQAAATERGEAWGLANGGEDIRIQIYPFLEWHDRIMKAINDAIENIPGLTAIVEKLSEAVSIFVFSLIAPFIMPILQQVKVELSTGSSEVIGSSKNQQFIVFTDHYSSNPTHSMLSKDHFTNCLNEPAGKIASEVVKFAVPLIMNAWDDEYANVDQILDEIVGGVFHHPAFCDGSDGRPGVRGRQAMFGVVRQWWEEKDEHERNFLRNALSREGVEAGRNHKAGQHDSGHGCGKPLHRVKPKRDGGEFGLGGDMGKVMGTAIEEALAGGQGGGSSGFGGLLGGIAGAALTGYMAGQMGSGGGGEVRERGLDSGSGGGYGGSYETSAHPRDTAYLKHDSYGTGEGRSYYGSDDVRRTESHGTHGHKGTETYGTHGHGHGGAVAYGTSSHGGRESYGTTGYGRSDSYDSTPSYEDGESYGEVGYSQEGYGHRAHSGGGGHLSHREGVSYGGGGYGYGANTGGYSEVREVSYSSHVSHSSSSHGGHHSYEKRVEHHHHHGSGSGGEYERKEKVYREDSGDERGHGRYTETRYKKHHSGEVEREHRSYRKHRSGDEAEIEYRSGSGDEEDEEEDEYERKKREKKERKKREKEHRRRGSGSGSGSGGGSGDEYYGSGDEKRRHRRYS